MPWASTMTSHSRTFRCARVYDCMLTSLQSQQVFFRFRSLAEFGHVSWTRSVLPAVLLARVGTSPAVSNCYWYVDTTPVVSAFSTRVSSVLLHGSKHIVGVKIMDCCSTYTLLQIMGVPDRLATAVLATAGCWHKRTSILRRPCL